MHSDHGANFTSWGFSENLRTWDITPSLGSVGDCFDNAAMESFWGRMQTELMDPRKTWRTVVELITAMDARGGYSQWQTPAQLRRLYEPRPIRSTLERPQQPALIHIRTEENAGTLSPSATAILEQ